MRKFSLLLSLFLGLCLIVCNVEASSNEQLLQSRSLAFRVDYQPIFISNQPALGVTGVHGLAISQAGFYGGVGLYGAVHGQYGGLFILGGDVGWQHQIDGPLWFDAGSFFGGGGGASAPVHNGTVVDPHVGFKYDLGQLMLGISYSHFGFINSQLQGNTVMLLLDIPFSWYEVGTSSDNNTKWSFDDLSNKDITFNHAYLALSGGVNQPKSGTTNRADVVEDNAYSLLGVSYGYYLTPHLFAFGKTDASWHNNAGFQDVFLGSGYDALLTPNIKGLAKLGVGAGGGGGVDTGGGVLLHPSLAAEYRLWHSFALGVSGGYILGPDADYHAFTTRLNLKYYFNIASKDDDGIPSKHYDNFDTQGWRVGIANQLMVSPQRNSDRNTDDNVNLFTFQLDYLLNPYTYLSGQTSYAYDGDAGAYASGMLGIGAQTPYFLNNSLQAFGAIYTGAAGGGGIDTGNGLLMRPEVGLTAPITKNVSLHASVGPTLTMDASDLNSTTLEVGVSYQFDALFGY